VALLDAQPAEDYDQAAQPKAVRDVASGAYDGDASSWRVSRTDTRVVPAGRLEAGAAGTSAGVSYAAGEAPWDG
jgi:hypothetical protein